MIVKRFKLDDLKDIDSASSFYKALGVDFKDEDLVGKKPSYKNFFIHPETDGKLSAIIRKNSGGATNRLDWFSFAPVSCGPRYEEMTEACGRIIRNALYILQPTDIIYEEAPDV